MPKSIRLRDEVGNEVNQTLTELLDLEDFVVVGYEQPEGWGRLILFCEQRYACALCPICGFLATEVHQYERRVVRDLAAWGLECYVEFDQRRFKCARCGVPFTEQLVEIEPRRHSTRRYEAYLFHQYQHAAISEIVRCEGLGYKAAQGIFYGQAARHLSRRDEPRVVRLGVDEISLKKRQQQFVLVISDLDRGCVLAVLEDRLMETFDAWLTQLSADERAAIVEVSMDMWQPYRLVVEDRLPQAHIVADRFHVMQNLNQAVTDARRALQRGADPDTKAALKGSRWLLVKNETDLSDEEHERLTTLYELSPELADLHQAKEAFRAIFESAASREEAAWRLLDWMREVAQQASAPLARFLKTLTNWGTQILNYFDNHTTQGFVEGMNNKIKLILRRGFGYRNFDHFALRLRIECG